MLCWDYTYRRLGRRSTRREKEPSLRLEEGREPRKDFEKFVESTILRLANNSPSFLCNEFKFKFQGLTVKKTKQQQHEKAKKSAIILVIRARNFEYLLLNAYKYLNAPVLIILTISWVYGEISFSEFRFRKQHILARKQKFVSRLVYQVVSDKGRETTKDKCSPPPLPTPNFMYVLMSRCPLSHALEKVCNRHTILSSRSCTFLFAVFHFVFFISAVLPCPQLISKLSQL